MGLLKVLDTSNNAVGKSIPREDLEIVVNAAAVLHRGNNYGINDDELRKGYNRSIDAAILLVEEARKRVV